MLIHSFAWKHATCAVMAAFVVLTCTGSPRAAVSPVGSWTTGLTHVPGAGTDRLLVFIASSENTTDIDVTNVTFGGQGMNLAAEAVYLAGPTSRCEIWTLAEAGIQAASGNSFVVSYSSGTPSGVANAAATFEGVDQSASVSGSASNTTASGTTISTPPFAVGAGGLAVSGAVHGAAGSYDDAAWGAGWAEGSDQAGASITLGTANTVTPYSSAGTDSATATHTVSSNRQVMVAVGIVASLSADLKITKTVDAALPSEADTITYTVILTNDGPATATNVDVTDQLPSGVTYVSHTTTQGSYNSGPGSSFPTQLTG